MNSNFKYKIFLVDDDLQFCKDIEQYILLKGDFEIEVISNGYDCLKLMNHKPDLVCLDFNLNDPSTETLLHKLISINKDLPVIIVSTQDDVNLAVNLLKAGAKDFIVKNDCTKDLLLHSISAIRNEYIDKNDFIINNDIAHYSTNLTGAIIGTSNELKSVFKLVDKAIHSTINISIVGENGTGKEIIAKAIHYNSERKLAPFVIFNVAAVPKELAESELFGHEKGAFLGAYCSQKGKLEEAEGGTLFIDEICGLELNLQSKLLRVLQEHSFTRIGGRNQLQIDIRLITATTRNFVNEIKAGNLREDLYFGIMGLPIELPPLRERGNDILVLAKYFIHEYSVMNNLSVPVMTPKAKDKLLKYSFPGNIRELKAIVELACVMCDGEVIDVTEINYLQVNPENFYTLEEKPLREYTIDIINFYLKKYNHNVVQIAEKLDIGKSTIYNMIKSGEISINK